MSLTGSVMTFIDATPAEQSVEFTANNATTIAAEIQDLDGTDHFSSFSSQVE